MLQRLRMNRCAWSRPVLSPSLPIGIGMTDLRALMHAGIFESAENGTLKVKPPPPIPISSTGLLGRSSPRFRGVLSSVHLGNKTILLSFLIGTSVKRYCTPLKVLKVLNGSRPSLPLRTRLPSFFCRASRWWQAILSRKEPKGMRELLSSLSLSSPSPSSPSSSSSMSA